MKWIKLFLTLILFTLVLPSVSFSGVIFEDDFSNPVDLNWVGGHTTGWSSATPTKWDWYRNQDGNQGAEIKVVPNQGKGGIKPALRFHWRPTSAQAKALTLQKYLHPTNGYDELYIRYQVKLSSNFYASDGTVSYWKWLRLHQNRNTALSPGPQGENKPPYDTRYIVLTAVNNPPQWGGSFSDNVNDPGGSVTGSQTKIRFSANPRNTTTSGHFQSTPQWKYNTNTGQLLNPTPQDWHTLEWRFKMNTGGNCDGTENGIFEMWIDGVKQTNQLTYKSNYGAPNCNAMPIQKYGVGWNSFYLFDNMAKWSKNWASNTYVYVDNVVVSDSYIGPNYTVGGTPPSDTTPPITTASPQGGNYTGSQTVTLTANEPSTTYYTTDGSTPTTLSPTYTSPVSITQDTTLSFFSIDTAGNVESIKTEFYIITPPPVASGCGPLSAPDPTDTIVTVTPAQASQLPSIVSNAGPGTTIFLEDGVYPITGTLRFQSDNVTLRSASGNRGAVIIDGQYQTNTLIQISASYVTIADITLKRTNEHLIHLLGGGHYANLYNLHLLDPTQQFIKENPSGGVVFNDFGTLACSLVELTAAGRPNIDPTGSGCYTGGIDAHQAWGWNVRDNIFKDIYCTNGGVAEHAIHFWRTSRDTVVERNTILNSARGIGFGLGNGTTPDRIYPDDPLAGVSGYVGHIGGIIKNNIIFGNIGSYFDSGIGLEQAWNAEVYHNTVYSSGGTFSSIDTRYTNSNPVIINNLVNPAMTVRGGGNPAKSGNIESASANMFVDVVNGDLHLVGSATAAIDNGVFLSGAVTDDIDEDIRDSQPDIGADEYIMGGVDITPPGDITNLQVTPGDGQVSISWINPSDSDYAGVMIRYRTDGTSPVDYTDGQPACDVQGGAGGSNSCVHTGLTNGQTYYYSAFTYDGVPNYSQTVNFTATPNATSNNPPDGIIDTPSGNVGIDVGQSVSFTATGSDPDGDIPISYLWNFGSGSGIPNSEIEDPGGKTFNNVGIFTITFTVTDSKGLSDPTPATVQVTVTEPDTTPPAPPQGIGLRVQ